MCSCFRFKSGSRREKGSRSAPETLANPQFGFGSALDHAHVFRDSCDYAQKASGCYIAQTAETAAPLVDTAPVTWPHQFMNVNSPRSEVMTCKFESMSPSPHDMSRSSSDCTSSPEVHHPNASAFQHQLTSTQQLSPLEQPGSEQYVRPPPPYPMYMWQNYGAYGYPQCDARQGLTYPYQPYYGGQGTWTGGMQ